jgi:Glycosyltransferase family 87
MRERDGPGVIDVARESPPEDGRRSRNTALAIGFAGLTLFAAFFLIRPFLGPAAPYGPRPAGTTYAYSWLVVAAFVPYGAAVWATHRGVGLPVALAGTALLHFLLIAAPLTQSQDLYMYLFYGKMWAVHGANPYLAVPAAFASDLWFPWVRWPNQPSVYGPIWTLLTSIPARLSPDGLMAAFLLAKALVLAFGLASVGGIVAACRARGIAPGPAVVLAAWNPVILVSLPLGGHVDVAVVAALVWAVVADRRGRPALAACLLAGATLVKPYAGIALVVYLVALARRRRGLLPAAAAAGSLAAAAYAPFWAGWDTFRGMADIAGRASASLTGELQRALSMLLGPGASGWAVRGVGLAIVAWVVVAGARREEFPADPWPTASAAFLAYVLVTPWFLYWHLAGLLALAAVAATPSVRAAAYTFCGTSMVTASLGGSALGRALQAALRYGPPLGLLWKRPGRDRSSLPRS